MSEVLLKVEHLSAAYGGIRALDDISLQVREGEIVAVLGANGAGKSTLLKCLSSEKKPAAGSILFGGKPLPAKPYNVVESGMVIVPEGRQIFYKLSVYDNLQIGCSLRKDKAGIQQDLEMVYEMFPRLKERENQYGGLLSGGEQQMLAIARGLMMDPEILMLDEPSLGLAPILVEEIFELIDRIHKTGKTILLIEQNAAMALAFADRGYVLESGKIVMSGTGQELLHNEQVMKVYLGG